MDLKPQIVSTAQKVNAKGTGITSHSYHLVSAISVTNLVICTVQTLLVSSAKARSKSYFLSGH